MIVPGQFRSGIVDVHVERFRTSPNSLADAFAVMWSIDAYASHIAMHLGKNETTFKDSMQDDGAWQFRLIREASNATKHAVRRHPGTDVDRSDKVRGSESFTGWAWYFSGARHCGPQIVISVDWKLQEGPTRLWHDAKGKEVVGAGPFFGSAPVFDLIEPALISIEERLP